MKQILVLLCTATCFVACKQKNGDYVKFTSEPVLYSKTVKRLNDVVLYNNFSPVVASRNYAYANIAAYECIAAGNKNYQSLSGQIKHLPAMPVPDTSVKIDFNLASLLAFVKVGNAVTFPEGVLMDYYDQLKRSADSVGMPEEVLDATVAYSDTVAATVLKWSKGDNYAKTRSSEKYTVKQEDGRWIPTPPMYGQGLEPHWAEIRTLVLDSSSQFLPILPPKFNMKDTTSQYCREVMEVKRTGEALTEEQKHIADFFDDNPFNLHVTGHVMYATKKFSPPGHWMNIVGIAAQKANADFAQTVAAYTETSIALFDGFISCWNSKYLANSVRPETVINKLLDPAWQPYIQTPPFPGYVSGHSVISAASAEVMTAHFGDNFSYRDSSEREFGIKDRNFTSFRHAADEASMSRLYGGIHFRCDLVEGQKLGRTVGEYIVNRLQLRKPSATKQLSSN